MAGLSDIFAADSGGDQTNNDTTTDEAKVENGPDNPDPRFGTDDGTDGTGGTDDGSTSTFDSTDM